MSTFSESMVEEAALEWFGELDDAVVRTNRAFHRRLRDTLLPKLLSGKLGVEHAPATT